MFVGLLLIVGVFPKRAMFLAARARQIARPVIGPDASQRRHGPIAITLSRLRSWPLPSEKSSSTWSRAPASASAQRGAAAAVLRDHLEVLEDAEWTTVRLWENAHDIDQYHEHAYTSSNGKQPPTVLEFKSSNDAMAAAIRKAKAEAAEIVRRWREEP